MALLAQFTVFPATEAALDRFDRHYESGELSAGNYERQTARVSEELTAVRAEADRRSHGLGEPAERAGGG